MIDKVWNPEMFAVARAARGQTQASIAESVGVGVTLISKWENGVVDPPKERVAQLAKALHYPEGLFYEPDRVRGTDSVCLHHRKRRTMPTRALASAEAEMLLAQVHTLRLLQHLNIETDLNFLTLDPDEFGGPSEVARRLRATWHIQRGPILNLVGLVESAGAIVLFRDMASRKLDGMSSWGKHSRPLFFLNAANPVDRARWTIAHELGHLVMHAAPTSGDPEVEADIFAQEFLTPADEIRADLRRLTLSTLPSLKAIWRVSMKALITTAGKLDALPPSKVTSLFVQYSRAGYNQGEPYPLSAEEPGMVPGAINLHLSEHGYSIDELAGVVRLLPDEFTTKWTTPKLLAQRRLRAV